MKKVFLAIAIAVILMFATSAAAAGPYLVCDPQPGVDHYIVSGLPSGLNGASIPPDATGTYGFKFDISTWPGDGKSYTLTAYACDSWGCSAGSLPLVLSRPSPLKTPTGVKMSAQ